MTYMYVATTQAGAVDAEPVRSVRRETFESPHDTVTLDFDEDGKVVGVEFETNEWFIDDRVRVEREGE